MYLIKKYILFIIKHHIAETFCAVNTQEAYSKECAVPHHVKGADDVLKILYCYIFLHVDTKFSSVNQYVKRYLIYVTLRHQVMLYLMLIIIIYFYSFLHSISTYFNTEYYMHSWPGDTCSMSNISHCCLRLNYKIKTTTCYYLVKFCIMI